MFHPKNKKLYSEVSDTKKNINSDYFNIFQSELKNLFPENKIKTIIDNKESISNNIINNETNNKTNNEKNKFTNKNKCDIEIDNQDVFFINLFSNHIKNNEFIK